MSDIPAIGRGACHAIFAFEVGQAVDLDACERLFRRTERQTVRGHRRSPQHFAYRPAPLRVPDPVPATIAELGEARIEAVLYDFGAAVVAYAVPLTGPLDGLVRVSCRLQGDGALLADARRRVEALITSLGGAVTRARVAESVEDYLVFLIETFAQPVPPSRLWTDLAPVVARTLRAEAAALSSDETAEAVSARLSFAEGDVTIVDWDAAVVYDPDPEETRALLEFANVQLLELRHLDQALDTALDRAYDAMARGQRGLLASLRSSDRAFRELAELQVESAVLFERVTNAIKLVGDQFLGRLYGLVSRRFHFADWDRAITRKLETIDGIYGKLTDRATSRRLEVLEWIVILLIALSIVLGLLQGH